MYPYLSLDNVNIDETVARRLPRRLAYYHLAIPIAGDDGVISVAMAYPDNRTVIQLIESVLNTPIIPVYSAADQIRKHLNRLWGEAADEPVSRILVWNDLSTDPQFMRDYAEQFAPLLMAEIDCLDAPSDASLPHIIEGNPYSLIVCSANVKALPTLLRHEARSSLLLVRGSYQPVEKLLVVLRGHAPDEDLLSRIIPLARLHRARVTLLAVTPTAAAPDTRRSLLANQFAALLREDTPQGAHLVACKRALSRAGIAGELRIRQGELETEIAGEVAGHSMIAIAAEAHGSVVYRVLSEIEKRYPTSAAPMLVIKP